MPKRLLGSTVLAAAAISISAAEAKAVCNDGGTLQYVCMSWQQDCAPTWIHSCWCCAS